MALQGMLTMDVLGTEAFRARWIESYLESLVQDQSRAASSNSDDESKVCWDDWNAGLAHTYYFGLFLQGQRSF